MDCVEFQIQILISQSHLLLGPKDLVNVPSCYDVEPFLQQMRKIIGLSTWNLGSCQSPIVPPAKYVSECWDEKTGLLVIEDQCLFELWKAPFTYLPQGSHYLGTYIYSVCRVPRYVVL